MIIHFGFLNSKWTIEFNGGRIEPLLQFDEAAALIESNTNEDGFFYPPTSRDVAVDPRTGHTLEEIPKTKRPARLFHLPSSHTLDIPGITPAEPHRESHAFVLHLLGYLFGVRLQFSDWYMDHRVPTRPHQTHNVYFSHATCQQFLSHCYSAWKSSPSEERKLLINVLAMHCRAPSYLWDWEQFMMEYTALDGCWNLATSQHGLKQNTLHKDRLHVMCGAFGIQHQNEGSTHIAEIARLRNELFHEATWDGSQPGMATGKGFMEAYNLRRLNQRLIPAILSYHTRYINTPWWYIDAFSFDP